MWSTYIKKQVARKPPDGEKGPHMHGEKSSKQALHIIFFSRGGGRAQPTRAPPPAAAHACSAGYNHFNNFEASAHEYYFKSYQHNKLELSVF